LNISKHEQRVLHELALGGEIHYLRAENGKVTHITCFSRDGHVLTNCTLQVFQNLKRKRLVRSKNSGPYRISRLGVSSVRAQMNQR
jgi:uncharacterized protein YjhX (UPF0386 family)